MLSITAGCVSIKIKINAKGFRIYRPLADAHHFFFFEICMYVLLVYHNTIGRKKTMIMVITRFKT